MLGKLEARHERFGFDAANIAADMLKRKMQEHGLNHHAITSMVVLDSDLSDFAGSYMNSVKAGQPSGPVALNFDEVFRELRAPAAADDAYTPRLIVGPLEGGSERQLVVAQVGQERVDHGISAVRSVFWLRVMQLMGTRNLIGTGTGRILTPDMLKLGQFFMENKIVSHAQYETPVHTDDELFGPRFLSSMNHYSGEVTEVVRAAVKRIGINKGVVEGCYVFGSDANCESDVDIRGMERKIEERQSRRPYPPAVVGPVTPYARRVATHASQSQRFPAFENRGYLTLPTRYMTSSGPAQPEERVFSGSREGQVPWKIRYQFSTLVREVLFDLHRQ